MTGVAVPAPPPPQGPGVQAPFVAPPTDGRRRRRWWAIGLSAGVVVLCCIGAVAGLGGLAVLGSKMIVDEARGVVTDYLGALKAEEFADAYDLLCPNEKAKTTKDQFVRQAADQPSIISYTVGEPQFGSQVIVPASIQYVERTVSVDYIVEQNQSTGGFEVCGNQ